MKLLLDQDADINTQSEYYENALKMILIENHEQIVKLLIDKSININT